ncbi:MAG: FAD-binding domain-containing protein [Kangiellaceae bacterium]|nr:FAD-binding domain-containing protein [Kangiellaceae bacterium]
MHQHGLYIFTNDLRLEQNQALVEAAASSQRLLLVYIVNPAHFKPNNYNQRHLGDHQWRFILESLEFLNKQLSQQAQEVRVIFDEPAKALTDLLTNLAITRVDRSDTFDYQLEQAFDRVEQNVDGVTFFKHKGNTLFTADTLPYLFNNLPATFAEFEAAAERLIATQLAGQSTIPTLPPTIRSSQSLLQPFAPSNFEPHDLLNDSFIKLNQLPSPRPGADPQFTGGADGAKAMLNQYLNENGAEELGETRSKLPDEHSMLSPWLAVGCITPSQIIELIGQATNIQQASLVKRAMIKGLTKREYSYWIAMKHQAGLYQLTGIDDRKLLTSYYAHRFQMWAAGNTPYPLINAFMKQLNATGFIPNSARYLLAHYFCNELGLDWRFGAAYFQQQLIDHDPVSNWSNWQLAAGVASFFPVREKINIEELTLQYDPDESYRRAWLKSSELTGNDSPMDHVDAADWPIMPKNH